jgi:6-phosphofructokinase 2
LETGVYLIKPNVGELAKLIGVERLEMEEVNDAAKQIISKAEPKSFSWSPRCGLVTKDRMIMFLHLMLLKKSTVGAGDSMVGGMVWALSK